MTPIEEISQIDYNIWAFKDSNAGMDYGYVCVEEARYIARRGFSEWSPQSKLFYHKIWVYYDRFKKHMPAKMRREFLLEIIG